MLSAAISEGEPHCTSFEALIMEFIGTFALISISAGVVTVLDPPNVAALAHGFVIMALAYAFRDESNSYLKLPLIIGWFWPERANSLRRYRYFWRNSRGRGIAGGVSPAAIYGTQSPHSVGMTTGMLRTTLFTDGLVLEGLGKSFSI